MLVDGVPLYSAPTDAIGAFEVFVDAPYQPRGERPFTIDGARRRATCVLGPSRASPTSRSSCARSARRRTARVRFRGRGFMQDAPVYAHYLFGGKEQKTVRLARRSTGPCGTFERQAAADPDRRRRARARWIVQVDQKRAYAAQPDPVWVRLPIDRRRGLPRALGHDGLRPRSRA